MKASYMKIDGKVGWTDLTVTYCNSQNRYRRGFWI
jgi:hypothetical protein